MHWLYFKRSPRQLEDAGFRTTRSGITTPSAIAQGRRRCFCLPGTKSSELPLTLWTPRCSVVAYSRPAEQWSGAALPCSMHGDSVGHWSSTGTRPRPERQWGRCYRDLLNEIAGVGWFATADRPSNEPWRRAIRFTADEGISALRVEAPTGLTAPPLLVFFSTAKWKGKPFRRRSSDLEPRTAHNSRGLGGIARVHDVCMIVPDYAGDARVRRGPDARRARSGVRCLTTRMAEPKTVHAGWRGCSELGIAKYRARARERMSSYCSSLPPPP